MADKKDSIKYSSNKEPTKMTSSSLESSVGLGSKSSIFEIFNKKIQDGGKISGGEMLTHILIKENVNAELKIELKELKIQKDEYYSNYISSKENLSLANQRNEFLINEITIYSSFDKLRSLIQNVGAALLGLLPFIITNLETENQILIGIIIGFISILLLLLPLFITAKNKKT